MHLALVGLRLDRLDNLTVAHDIHTDDRHDRFHVYLDVEVVRSRGQWDFIAGLFAIDLEKNQRTAGYEGPSGAKCCDPLVIIELRTAVNVGAIRTQNVAAIEIREGVFARRRY